MRTRQGVTGNAGLRVAVKAILSLLLIVLLVTPFGSSTRAEGDEGLSDLSLYQRTSELTRELGTKLAPGSQSDLGMLAGSSASDKLTGGNAGGLLGYSDVGSDDKGVLGWLMTPVTGSSKTTTYDQILNMVPSNSTVDAGFKNPFFQYAGYGEALHNMGLTTTIREGDVLGQPGRLLGTGVMLLAYLLANVAPFVFKMALFILVTFNPFRFFATVFDAASAADLGMLSGVADYVGSLYNAVQDFSLYILLPMFLVMMLLSILMVKKGSALQKIGRYATRVFMLFAGLPLIAATYTGTVEGLQAKVNVGSEYANYLVMSSYVDFEGWVKTSRLAPPSDNVIRNPRLAAAAGQDESMTLPNRSLVLEINGDLAGNDVAKSLADRYDSTSNLDEIFQEGGELKELKSSSKADAATNGGFSSTISMLMRHIGTSTYSGAQYDGEVAGQIQKIRSKEENATDEAIVKMFSLTASDARTWKQCSWFGEGECQDWMKPIDWDDAEGLFTKGAAVDGTFKFGGYSQNIYNSGALTFEAVSLPNGGSTLGYTAHGVNPPSGGLAPIGTTTASTVGGLSPLAMYNFLNTRFSDTGLVVYSTEKSLSELTKGTYSAVTFAGSGISVFTRWLENVVVMLSLASLSLMYAWMMLSAALRNIPRVLSGMFGTAMGSLAMTTKLLVSTLAMIIQVIGMIFLYALSENILMTLLLNFNEVTSDVSNFFQQGSVVLEFARATLVIVTTAGLTVFLIKNMYVFQSMMEEVVTNLITRVMSVLDTSTGGQGLSASEMSGGRVDNSGHLTEDAKKDNKYGGFTGGVRRALGDAHGIESERERLAEDLAMKSAESFDEDGRPLDKDGNVIDWSRSTGEKLAARLGTGKDLHSALAADKAKGLLGVDGKSYEREKGAHDRKTRALADGDLTALGRSAMKEYMNETKNARSETNKQGQVTDENGEVKLDANGNAMDADGNIVSAASALSLMSGKKALTDDSGHLLDEEGSFYTDELGNAFKQDEKGRLIDEDGAFVALDADGSLRPVDEIPGHNGKPVNATQEAKKLDGMRRDAKAYAAMRDEQGASHYGLDKDGNVMNEYGEAVALRNGDKASLDKEGFLVNKAGERVDAREVLDKMDERGYEKVTDPETGVTHMRHRGDAAMRNRITPQDNSTPTTLAKQAARAHDIASRAQGRVEQLAAAGAPAYAIAQAQRYAASTAQQAKETQQRFDSALKEKGFPSVEPVTKEHVAGMSRSLSEAKTTLQTAEAAVQTLREQGAPPKQIAKAQARVDKARQNVSAGTTKLADAKLAASTGRSISEVANARDGLAKAEKHMAYTQTAYAQAVANNAPPEVIQEAEERLQKATVRMAARRGEMTRVSQAPSGSRADINQATAKVINMTTSHGQANAKLQTLQASGGSPAAIKEAKRAVAKTAGQLKAAKAERATLLNPTNWSNEQPTLRKASTTSVQKSAAALQSAGVVSYEDYGREVAARTEAYHNKNAQLKSAQQRLQSSEGKRPPQIVAKMRETVATLKQEVAVEQSRVATLQDNAHGLLKTKKFKPMMASRPIQANGAVILNQMTMLRETQASIDRLSRKAAKGTITPTEQKTLNSLQSTAPGIRQKLVAAGIREDALSSTTAIAESAKHFGQSWDSFVNGTSTEV